MKLRHSKATNSIDERGGEKLLVRYDSNEYDIQGNIWKIDEQNI